MTRPSASVVSVALSAILFLCRLHYLALCGIPGTASSMYLTTLRIASDITSAIAMGAKEAIARAFISLLWNNTRIQ